MRIFLAALVVFLGIVSATLWNELRSSRLQLVDLQDQLVMAKDSAEAARAEALRFTALARSAPAVTAQVPQPQPVAPVAPPAPAPPRAPSVPPPVVSASVPLPLTTGSFEERRAQALMQSDGTAMARVRAWSTVLNLTPEQLQALNEAAMAELRVETEESLAIDSTAGPMDAQAAVQLKIETLNRQHATNLRILEKMTPQMTLEQSNMMRTMFEGWIRPRLAAARAEQEMVANSGN